MPMPTDRDMRRWRPRATAAEMAAQPRNEAHAMQTIAVSILYIGDQIGHIGDQIGRLADAIGRKHT